jgi:hypothetical protein
MFVRGGLVAVAIGLSGGCAGETPHASCGPDCGDAAVNPTPRQVTEPVDGIRVVEEPDRTHMQLEGVYARSLFHSLGYVSRNPFAQQGRIRHRTANGVHCRLDSAEMRARCELTFPPTVVVEPKEDYLEIRSAPIKYGAVTAIAHAISIQVAAQDKIYFYNQRSRRLATYRLPDRSEKGMLRVGYDPLPCPDTNECASPPSDEALLRLPELAN